MGPFLAELPLPAFDVRAWQLGTALLLVTGCEPFGATGDDITPIDDAGDENGCGPQGCDGGDCGGDEGYDDEWGDEGYDDEGTDDESGQECALDCGSGAVCVHDTCVGMTVIPACEDMAIVHTTSMPINEPVLALTVLQADQDGEPELAVALADRLEVFLGDTEPVSSVLGEFPGVMAAADLDGDGLDELLISPSNEASLQIHRNLGAGLLPLGDVVDASRYAELRTHDFDGDGTVDVVGRVEGGGPTHLLTGDGDFHLAAPFDIDPGLHVEQIAVAEEAGGAVNLVLGNDVGLNAWSGADGAPFDPLSVDLASYPYVVDGWDVEVAKWNDDAHPDVVSVARHGEAIIVVAFVQFEGGYPSASARFAIDGASGVGEVAHLEVADLGLGVERPVLWGDQGAIAVLDGCWVSVSNARVVALESGDFDGDGQDEIFVAHPLGLDRVDIDLIEE